MKGSSWKGYRRGNVYRLGRRRWYGIEWWKSGQIDPLHPSYFCPAFETKSLWKLEKLLVEVQKGVLLKQQYQKEKWLEIT